MQNKRARILITLTQEVLGQYFCVIGVEAEDIIPICEKDWVVAIVVQVCIKDECTI